MKIFSSHRRVDSKKRFGSVEFRNRLKNAANYKRAFNPSNGFSIKLFPDNKLARITQISGLAVLALAAYYLVLSPALLIEEVHITGNHQVSTQQITDELQANGSARFFLIRKNNFFIMTQGRVNRLLTDRIPTIKEVVKLDRKWPNKAVIEVREHNPGFVIESNANYFLVDDEGIVVSQVDSPGNLLVVSDQLTENFVRGEALPNSKLAPFVLSMNKLWNSKIASSIVAVKFVGKNSSDVQFITEAGWGALFDTGRPVSVQLGNLAVILNKQIPQSEQANLAYIDLRLSKWAYYCFKESPCQQKEQPVTAGSETNVE